jgi:nucleoside 2-deoxyribosyltransferase
MKYFSDRQKCTNLEEWRRERVKVYLSGPIEHDDPDHNWRDNPKRVLTERFKINVFDPFADPKQQFSDTLRESLDSGDWKTAGEIAHGFVRKDLALVDRADFIVAYLPKGVCTTGTHHEIIWANNAKKPTLLVCPQGKKYHPAWYFGFIDPQFMFGSWDELYDYLEEVDEGKHKDNDRWEVMYGVV